MDTVITSTIYGSLFGALAGFVSSALLIRHKEKEREKTERQLFIHRLQFEKEFDVLRELWSLVIEVPGLSSETAGDYSKRAKLNELQKRIDKYIRDSIPFIMPNIEQKVKAIADTASQIGALIDFNQTPPRQKLKERGDEFKKLDDQINNLGKAIRSRILLQADKGKH